MDTNMNTNTDTQTEPTATGPQNTPANVLLYGTQEEIRELARRLRQFLPNTRKMSDNEVLAFAQYCISTGLNPFRREVHGWDSRGDGTGDLVTTEHYKLIARWARSQEPFSATHKVELADNGDIIATCYLMRDSSRQAMIAMLHAGAPYDAALALATVEGHAILRKAETVSKSPPKGRDWPWVARKRALVDAIAQAYGMPSGQELSAQSWIVNGRETVPADYENANGNMLPAEIEAEAEYSARERQRHASSEPAGSAADAQAILFGDW